MSLYHYTDEVSARAIAKSGKIKASKTDGPDAVYGEGVYLTSLPPSNTTETLVGNNYDDGRPGAALMKKKASKTEWVVEVPKGKATRVSGKNRDVYLHVGDLKLDKNCKIYHRKTDEHLTVIVS